MYQVDQPQDRISTLNLVLLSFVTCGIYSIIYLWRMIPSLIQYTQKSFKYRDFLLAITICLGVSILMTSFSYEMAMTFVNDYLEGIDSESDFSEYMLGVQVFDLLASFLTLASGILYIILSFKLRAFIEEYAKEKKINLSTNKVMTFFFSIFYINYLINQTLTLEENQKTGA
ncbi:hypothetical protein BKK49_10810 [Rodentibacter rarus]|uniref:DUF4234 domain-containing protein n=1 Tax=Rodentibacter rarus TaxID=1908260 RepID=UPI00098714C8|nr:DUF4234 domain-containing protein [Rodentibacter rarus]OOF37926.1 hypothetical protein BKK49_10810 [Rodentibacter rarus]